MNSSFDMPMDRERMLFSARPPSAPGPDVAHDLDTYRSWVRQRESMRLQNVRQRSTSNLEIAVLLLVDRHRSVEWAQQVAHSVDSILGQTFLPTEICVAAYGASDTSREWDFEQTIRGAANLENRLRSHPPGSRTTQLSWLGPFHDVGAAAHEAFSTTVGDAVLVLEDGDQLVPDALALLADALADGYDLAYGDDDRLSRDGRLSDPRLKPNWSPELLLSNPYLGRPLLIRRSLLTNAGGFASARPDDWEHDMQLRVTEWANSVFHVPEVLCHIATRLRNAPSGSEAVNEALRRRGETAAVEANSAAEGWSVVRLPPRPVSACAIIPLRDAPSLLRTCIDTLLATVTVGRTSLEFVLVDNGSVEPETLTLLEELDQRTEIQVVSCPAPFNWAALSNMGANQSEADVLLFMNNDIEAHRPGWLDALCAQALRADVAAVGARLLYSSGQVQHAGIVLGLGGAAGHVLAGLPADEAGYLGMAVRARECTAVTGACLATRRAVFDELGGFDEHLGLDLNDVDYCLRAEQAGYRVLVEPRAELIHHESPSRGTSGSATDIRRFLDRWQSAMTRGDGFLHPQLTRLDSSCALRRPDEEEWWRNWLSTLPKA